MERMTCGNGGIGLGIALGLAEADSVQNLIERRLIYCTRNLRNPPQVGPESPEMDRPCPCSPTASAPPSVG